MPSITRKAKPIPVKIVSGSGPQTAPSPERIKPTLSVDVSPSLPLHKPGTKVTVHLTGTVIGHEVMRRRWDGNKTKARLEVEYAPSAIEVESGQKSLEAMEDDDARI